MASINIPNAPQFLTPLNFRAAIDAGGGLAKSARFATRILPTGGKLLESKSVKMGILRELVYLCEIVDMPGRGFNSNPDVHYYGPSMALPFQSAYNELDMTILCRTDSMEREFFDDWMNLINPNNTFDFEYRDNYRADIEIYQFAEAPIAGQSTPTVISKDPGAGLIVPQNSTQAAFVAGGDINATAPEAKYKITAHDAWPLQVQQQPMTWGDEGFQRLVVTFTYQKWSRVGLDKPNKVDSVRGGAFSLVEARRNGTGGF